MKIKLLSKERKVIKETNIKSNIVIKVATNRVVKRETIKVIQKPKTLSQIYLKDNKVKIITSKQGIRGATGKSAYESAVSKGFIGTEEQWIESLKAPDNTDVGDTTFNFVAHFRSLLNDPSF